MEIKTIEEGLRIASEYGDKFAFDGCHKIYILNTLKEEKQAIKDEYRIYDIKNLKDIYKNSCPLKFVSSWNLKISFVKQR